MNTSSQLDLNSPHREREIVETIKSKSALRQWYLEVYGAYREIVKRQSEGRRVEKLVELGAGAGFCKEVIPEVLCTDIIPYDGIDLVVDATKMPFSDQSVSAFFMTNVLHHIPDAMLAFQEIARCLHSGGECLIVDQYPGLPAKFIYKYLHHEDFNDQVAEWGFPSSGPLSLHDKTY